jgi:hypothetical protein
MGYEDAKQRGRAAMALIAECCKRKKGATELFARDVSATACGLLSGGRQVPAEADAWTRRLREACLRQCAVLTRRTLRSRNRSTTNGCADIALRHFAQKTLFRRAPAQSIT